MLPVSYVLILNALILIVFIHTDLIILTRNKINIIIHKLIRSIKVVVHGKN